MDKFLLDINKSIRCDIKELVRQRASNIAINITELECDFNDIYCYSDINNKECLTDEAKIIFDYYYEEEYNKQLEFVKNIFNIINESKYRG